MRKSLTLGICLSVLAAGFLWSRMGADAARPGNDFGFGKRIAGTWVYDEFVVDVGFPEPISFPTFRTIQTMNADGTYVHATTGQIDFDSVEFPEGFDPDHPEIRFVSSFESTAHGSWRRTGPRSIESIQLSHEDGPDGETLNYARVRVYAEYARDFESAELSAVTEFLDPADDPLDPDATVMTTWFSEFRGRKLQFDDDGRGRGRGRNDDD